MSTVEWDAKTYDSLPLPHLRWGEGVVERLQLAGSEAVLELGAGTGRDTARLLRHLPRGRVVAVDVSTNMLDHLRMTVSHGNDRLTIVEADLREPLHITGRVEAAMSVATLHWLPDHMVVFRSVAAALRPGGRFVAECGGAGNIEAFRRAAGAAGVPDREVWNFATPEDTVARLLETGFTGVQARLVQDPAVLERGGELEAYIATVLLPAHLAAMPEDRRAALVRAVADAMPEPVIDYVRLQITATKL